MAATSLSLFKVCISHPQPRRDLPVLTARPQALFLPAVISLLIFLVLTFVLVPVWRRYRSRYSQYLPLDSISDRTSSLRHRIVGRFAGLNPLATFLSARQVVFAHGAADDGEELGDVDEETWRAIESHVPSAQLDSSRRLSREYAIPVFRARVSVADGAAA